MKVTICIGSSCHLNGARIIVERLQSFIANDKLQDKIDLCGAFCMGNCEKGVSVKIDDKLFYVTPNEIKKFYDENILSKI